MEELGLFLILLTVLTFFSPQLTLWVLLLISTIVAYSFFRNRFSGGHKLWSSKGIRQPRWNIFPLGNNAANSTWVKMGRTDPVDAVKKQYKDMVGGEEDHVKVYGTYDFGLSAKPVAYLADLELARKALEEGGMPAKCSDRESKWPVDAACDTRTDRIWARQLVNLNGEEWKKMHGHMSSLLSDENLRRLSPTIGELAERMADEADKRIRDRRHLDLVALFQALMVDCVAQCVFRYDAKPYRIDRPTIFHHVVTKLLKRRVDTDALRLFISRHVPLGRRLMSLLGISVFKPTEVAYLSDLLVNAVRREGPTVTEAVRGLNVAGEDMTNCLGDDAANIFDEMINSDPDIEDERLCALAMNFITHGIEEISAAAARATFELYRHPKAQKRLSTQIDQVIKSKGSLDYDALKSFALMESLILESLRRYPNVSHITRNCSSPYQIGDLQVDPGVKVNIPISGMTIDSRIYPAPEDFKPRRFLKQEKKDKFLGFGLGARKCLGQNFVLLVAKSGLSALLARFELVRSVVSDPSPDAIGYVNPYLWVEAVRRTMGGEGESSLAYMRMSSIEFEEESEEEIEE